MSSRAFLLALTKGWALRGRNEVMNSELSCKTPVKFQVKPPQGHKFYAKQPCGLKMSLVIFELTPFFKFGYVSVLFLDTLSPAPAGLPSWFWLTQLDDPAFFSSQFSFLSSLLPPFSVLLFPFCPFLTQRRSIRLPTCLQKRLVSLLHLLFSPHPSPSAVLFHFSVFFCVCDFWIFCFPHHCCSVSGHLVVNFTFLGDSETVWGWAFSYFLWSSFEDCWLLLHYKAYGSQKLTLSLIFVLILC